MKNKQGKGLHMVTFLLLAVGGLNWLVFGIWQTDLGAWLGGMDSTVARVVYVLVGLAAIYEVATHKRSCSCCGEGSCGCGGSCGSEGGSCEKCGKNPCVCGK